MKSAAACAIFSVLITATHAYSIDINEYGRISHTQDRLDRICGNGVYFSPMAAANDGNFLLCEMLRSIDRQTDKLNEMESDLDMLSRQ